MIKVMKNTQQIIEILYRGVELCAKFRKSIPMSVQQKLMDRGDFYSVPLPADIQQEIIDFCYEAQASLTSADQEKLHSLFSKVNRMVGFDQALVLIRQWRDESLTLEQVHAKIEKSPLKVVR